MRSVLNLARKELRLCLHPTNVLFLLLSAMVLIPNYPYEVIFFYTSLGLFFTCLTGRENGDLAFTLALPVSRSQAVAGRMLFALCLQLAQALVLVPFLLLRAAMGMGANLAGLDANVALLGTGLCMMGVFNVTFFPRYYRAPDKVGIAFLWGSVAQALFLTVEMAAVFAIPWVREVIDTPDPVHLGWKLLVLAAGLALYLLMTALAYRRACRNFARVDF